YAFQADVSHYAAMSLSGVFSYPNSATGHVSSSGLLVPGSYTLIVNTAGFFLGTNSADYALTLSDPPGAVGAPVGRPETCHQYVQLSPSTGNVSEQVAVRLGGHLVTINDAAEQAWLETTFASVGPSLKWIGLRGAPNGQFTWLSGQPVTYRNWGIGAP